MFFVGQNLVANLLGSATDRITVCIGGRESLSVDVAIPIIPGDGKAFIRSRNFRIGHMRIHRGIDPELGTIGGAVCVIALTKDTIRGASINARAGRVARPGDHKATIVEFSNRRRLLGSGSRINNGTIAIRRDPIATRVD